MVRWSLLDGALAGAVIGWAAGGLRLQLLLSWWGDPAWLVAVGAVAGAGLVALGQVRRLRACALVFLAGWILVGWSPVAGWLARSCVVADRIRPADAVVVLGSSIHQGGTLTDVSTARILTAIELVEGGFAPVLVVTRTVEPVPPYRPEVERLLRNLHIEAPVVEVGPVANTRDEVMRVRDAARERGWETVLVVTSPTHTRRARAAFLAEELAIVSVPAREPRYELERLDDPGERLAAFGDALHEIVGLWWYRRQGWA